MEEFLILLFQVIVELFLGLPWDWLWYGEREGGDGQISPFWIGFWSMIAGGVLAGLSLLLFPDVIARRSGLRLFLLFFAPVFAGTTGYWMAKWKERRRDYVVPREHFWWSFMFTLGYMMVRFGYAHRG